MAETLKATEGLAYTVIDCNGTGKVQWEADPVLMTADEAVRQEESSGGEAEVVMGNGRFLLSGAAADGRAMGMARVPGRGPQAGKGWAMNDSPTSALGWPTNGGRDGKSGDETLRPLQSVPRRHNTHVSA